MIEFLALAGWLAIGAAVATIMWRRGFDGWAWFVAGVFLGPFAIGPALVRRSKHVEIERLSDSALVDVLAGIDASSASRAAVACATSLLGPRFGRLTLATCVPIDSSPEAIRIAKAELAETAATLARWAPSEEVITGRAAEELPRVAAEAGYDLIVVGTSGAGLSKKLLGSTSRGIARDSKVPVLLVPSDH